MQNRAFEVRRIPLPRTWVNKKLVPRCVFVGTGVVKAGNWTFCYRSEGKEPPSDGLLGVYSPPLRGGRFIYRAGRARERSYQ